MAAAFVLPIKAAVTSPATYVPAAVATTVSTQRTAAFGGSCTAPFVQNAFLSVAATVAAIACRANHGKRKMTLRRATTVFGQHVTPASKPELWGKLMSSQVEESKVDKAAPATRIPTPAAAPRPGVSVRAKADPYNLWPNLKVTVRAPEKAAVAAMKDAVVIHALENVAEASLRPLCATKSEQAASPQAAFLALEARQDEIGSPGPKKPIFHFSPGTPGMKAFEESSTAPVPVAILPTPVEWVIL